MTNKEAVKILSKTWFLTEQGREAAEMAIKALENAEAPMQKEIPKPPRDADPLSMWVCPECAAAISPNDCYCSQCGQKIQGNKL